MKPLLLTAFASFFMFISYSQKDTEKKKNSQQPWQLQIPSYKPQSQELYDNIVRMDSLWEDSYNNCKMEAQEQLISDDLEFYHDGGGLMKSKTDLIAALKNNICGKVTRELLAGSLEVYPIKGYGAVEMGYHRFYNKMENSRSNYARFVHIWRQENGAWKITRVISLH
ncbi:nuclear transport factor 2 family protein [Longitalea luteola]|uniref:nuclear transport factor 2 family protein n=1 Tax=Longitalea luteola TaxID=2812563 RepID=UPI001F61ADB5|nr:nuclear transport factor 2 family protein [Longitalea luteola]